MITADQFDRELDFLVTIALVEGFWMLWRTVDVKILWCKILDAVKAV